MAYKYRTGRRRRVQIWGTCSYNASWLCSAGSLTSIKGSSGRVWRGIRDPQNDNAVPSLIISYSISSTLNSDGSRTYRVYGPSLGVTQNAPVDTFTVGKNDQPVTKSYSNTSTFEIWCECEELITLNPSGTPAMTISEQPYVGGTQGWRIDDSIFQMTTTDITVRPYLLYGCSYECGAETFSYRGATYDSNGFISNFGAADQDFTGGTATGSLDIYWGGGGCVKQAMQTGRSWSYPFQVINTVRSGGQDVTVTQNITRSGNKSGSTITVNGVPIPPNVTPNDKHETGNGIQGGLGFNVNRGRFYGYLQSFRRFDVTAAIVGPGGGVINDISYGIRTNTSGDTQNPPLYTTNGVISWSMRLGPGGNITLPGDAFGAVNDISYNEFPNDAGYISRNQVPVFMNDSTRTWDDTNPWLLRGHKWARRGIGAHGATRYVFGESGKPLPPTNVGIGVAGWITSGSGATIANNTNGLQVVTSGNNNAGAGAKLNSYRTDWEHRYYRVRYRSVGSANKSITFALLPFDVTATNPTDAKIDVFVNSTGNDGEWKEVVLDRLAPYKAIAASRGRRYVDTEATLPSTSDPIEMALIESDTGTFALYGLSPSTTYEIAWVRGERQVDAVVESTYARQYAAVDGKRTMLHEPGDGGAPPIPNWGSSIAWPEVVLDQARANLPGPFDGNGFLPASDLYNSRYEFLTELETDWAPVAPTSAKTNQVTIQVQEAFVSFVKPNTKENSVQQLEISYPGAGDVFNNADGAYGFVTPLRWEYVLGTQLRGAVVADDPATPLPTVRMAEIIASGEASARLAGDGAPGNSGYYVTQEPYAYRPRPNGLESYLLDGNSPKDGYRGKLWGSRRYWFLAPTIDTNQPICVDSGRGWLHLGKGKQIVTYHEALLAPGVTPTPVWTPTDHPVDEWLALCYDERLVTLFGASRLAKQEGETRGRVRVYRSRDGGKHITEILTMVARTMAMERDSERGVLLLIYEAEGYLSRKISRDGGATWETTTTPLFDGATVPSGEVLDLAQDARQAGVFWLSAKAGDEAKLFRSRDLGLKWTSVLS